MAIIDEGQCFLKSDATTRERFVAAGCVPFCFTGKGRRAVETSYFRPPEEAMESPPLMLPWARLALEAALRAANAAAAKAARRADRQVGEHARQEGRQSPQDFQGLSRSAGIAWPSGPLKFASLGQSACIRARG